MDYVGGVRSRYNNKANFILTMLSYGAAGTIKNLAKRMRDSYGKFLDLLQPLSYKISTFFKPSQICENWSNILKQSLYSDRIKI